MLDTLSPTARSLVIAWLARTNPDKVKTPTDIAPRITRAFFLGIEATIARDTDKAEQHFCVLQEAEVWEHAAEAVRFIQSLSAVADTLHRHSKLAADTLQIRRVGNDLDDLAARIAAI